MIDLRKASLAIVVGVVVCTTHLWSHACAQTSDLRYSRVLPPGLSDTYRLKVSVTPDPSLSSDLVSSIAGIAKMRLEQLGYSVMHHRPGVHTELVVYVTCHAVMVSEPSSQAASDSVSRARQKDVLHSPPCQIAYSYQGELIPWKKVDRFIYAEGVSAMGSLGTGADSQEAAETIRQFIRHYEFPILLAAEWGHVPRVSQVLNAADASLGQKTLAMRLLGEIQDPQAFPVLVDKLQDPTLAKAAARSLGCYALRGRPYLLEVLQYRADPLLQTAAATGLGKIAAATGDSEPTPLFLEMVVDSSVDIRVKTALVWAIGKAPDFRAYPTLENLERSVWLDHSNDPELERLREAVNWSIREVKQGGHGDDF